MVHVQAWFCRSARRASRRVDFDKATQSFDAKSVPRLFAIADPTGPACKNSPVREPRAETLISKQPAAAHGSNLALRRGPVMSSRWREVKDVLLIRRVRHAETG